MCISIEWNIWTEETLLRQHQNILLEKNVSHLQENPCHRNLIDGHYTTHANTHNTGGGPHDAIDFSANSTLAKLVLQALSRGDKEMEEMIYFRFVMHL